MFNKRILDLNTGLPFNIKKIIGLKSFQGRDTHLKKTIYKNIYRTGKHSYTIRKQHKNKTLNKTFHDLNEAKKYLERWEANNFQPIPDTQEYKYEHDCREYYKHIVLYIKTNPKYRVYNQHSDYLKQCDTIEEALYFRDLYGNYTADTLPDVLVDLRKDNPYIVNGLAYPIPERLTPPEIEDTNYGKGQIICKGPQSYHVRYNADYFCACRTYEQAYYVRKELQKCGWDKNQVHNILEGYPEWYTWLINFYKYITPYKDKWKFSLTPSHNRGKLSHLVCSNLEDALWERDLYVKYDFNDELVVYYADDTLNPYYNMELPPYPQRKIRRINDRDSHKVELDHLKDFILEYGYEATLTDFCEVYGFNSVSIRNWLKNYDIGFGDFKKLVLSGEDPWELLELKPLVYNPDLSRHYPNKGYIQSRENVNGTVFIVNRYPVYYGSYPSRELAEKVVKELHKCGWDKSQMPRINKKVGFESIVNSKRWVYPNPNGSYSVRHKDKNRHMVNFGTYRNKEKAEFVRDKLIECGWDEKIYNESIRPLADKLYPDRNIDKYIHRIKRKYDYYFTIGKDGKRFGKYSCLGYTRIVRDLLMHNNWDESLHQSLEVLGEWIYHVKCLYDSSFIKRCDGLWI